MITILRKDHRFKLYISVSTKFLTWDLATSEICRDVDPQLEGLMLGLAVSRDNRQAAAYTSNNQVGRSSTTQNSAKCLFSEPNSSGHRVFRHGHQLICMMKVK